MGPGVNVCMAHSTETCGLCSLAVRSLGFNAVVDHASHNFLCFFSFFVSAVVFAGYAFLLALLSGATLVLAATDRGDRERTHTQRAERSGVESS